MTIDEDAVRALLRAATPDLPGVEIDDLSERREGAASDRRHGRVWALTGVVAAVVIVATVLALLRGGSAPHAAHPAATPVDYDHLVLRDGDTVTASGQVVAIAGRPIQLCDPYVADTGIAGPRAITACDVGVTVTGLNLHRLGSTRRVGSSLTGTITVTGTFHAGVIAVRRQKPESKSSPPSDTDFDQSPCSAPPGGWPMGHELFFDAIHRYGRAHPGSIVDEAELHPTRTSPIAYVLTAGSPDPVRRVLARTFGKRLCVVHSIYTPAQIAEARRVFSIASPQMKQAGVTMTGGSGFDDTLQPEVTATLRQLTPTLAHAATRLAPGLLALTIWLTP